VPSALKAKLGSLEALRPGWDSYSAPPPSKAAIERLAEILQTVVQDATVSDILANIHIGPSLDGGALLAWKNRGRTLEIEIDPSGNIEVSRLPDDDAKDIATKAVVDGLGEYVEWLSRGSRW
jgi:hypothetical protein